MSLNIKKNGIIETELFSEYIVNTFDKNFYVEPDGSVWIRISHHNNPVNALFNSTDTFASQVYLDADRWFNVALCNLISNSWELMIKQKTTSDATETKYRWIQTVNPMVATFNQTKVENVTKITTSGYTNLSNYGGIYVNNSNAYLVNNNGNSGNWYGAIGSWTLWSGGIPGMGSAVTTGYLDLYLRIDNHTNLSKTAFGKDFITSREIIEY